MSLPKVLYVSRLPLTQTSGGGSGVNIQTYNQLQQHFNCTYFHAVVEHSVWHLLWSKLLRKILKLPSRYTLYGKKNLLKIADSIQRKLNENTYDLVFFREFTPFIETQLIIPYVAYNDVDFAQYFENTFSASDFVKKDIERIKKTEAKWLENASCVFYESDWGRKKTIAHYGINPTKLIPLGLGGNIPLPTTRSYDINGREKLLFIANNYFQKGGDIALKVFKKIKTTYPTLEFHIIGGAPEKAFLQEESCYYHGFLSKNSEQDLKKFTQLLKTTFFLIHPTREDVNPLVIIEAGLYACPTISVNKFAIPELVADRNCLVPYPAQEQAIIDKLTYYLNHEKEYQVLCEKTAQKSLESFSWESIGLKLKKELNSVIGNDI